MQGHLFGWDRPDVDASFRQLRRVSLVAGAWYEHAPSWLLGHERLFQELRSSTHFRSEQRQMYDRVLEVPRLHAVLPKDGPVPPILERARTLLDRRYGEAFARISVAYYRDGRDSVAWHGDYVARRMPEAVVATLSLGAPRRFLLRPYGGGRSLSLSLGEGDLFVMGGSCQRTWQHCIPKVARAGPRMAVMFRPEWYEPGADQSQSVS